MKMKKAIFPGSFDPITTGHLDLIRRASDLFDQVVVVVLDNSEKRGMFSPEQKLSLVNAAVAPIGNVSAMLWTGLTSDAARKVGADYILRGARNATDFDYEYNLACIMKRFDKSAETVILPADNALSMISSTYVRELIKYRCDLSGSVPDACVPLIQKFYGEQHD